MRSGKVMIVRRQDPLRLSLAFLVLLACSLNLAFMAAEAKTRHPLSSKPIVIFPDAAEHAIQNTTSKSIPQRIEPEANEEAVAVPAIPTEPEEAVPTAPSTIPQRIYDKATEKRLAQTACPNPVIPPRSSGIRAVTTNARGETIYLQPLQGAVPNFSFAASQENQEGDGYNALFQAEIGSRQRVDSLIFAAQQAYRQKEYPKALEALKNATRLDTNNSDLVAAIGEVQLEMRHHDEAIEAYKQADQLTPGRHRLRYAQILALSGQRKEAIALLKTTPLPESKQEAQRSYLLGTLYEELGQLQEALSYLTEAARLQPNSADIRYNLGLTCELAGQKAQAYQHYRQAQILDPHAVDIKQAIARTKK